MIDTNEALARIALAEFEARRLQRRTEQRARRWRIALAGLRILTAVGAAVYIQVTDWQISGAQACVFLLIYLAASVWAEHRTGESLRQLQTEVERLKDAIDNKPA